MRRLIMTTLPTWFRSRETNPRIFRTSSCVTECYPMGTVVFRTCSCIWRRGLPVNIVVWLTLKTRCTTRIISAWCAINIQCTWTAFGWCARASCCPLPWWVFVYCEKRPNLKRQTKRMVRRYMESWKVWSIVEWIVNAHTHKHKNAYQYRSVAHLSFCSVENVWKKNLLTSTFYTIFPDTCITVAAFFLTFASFFSCPTRWCLRFWITSSNFISIRKFCVTFTCWFLRIPSEPIDSVHNHVAANNNSKRKKNELQFHEFFPFLLYIPDTTRRIRKMEWINQQSTEQTDDVQYVVDTIIVFCGVLFSFLLRFSILVRREVGSGERIF